MGGVAVNLHGVVRATEDVDFLVGPERQNVERLEVARRSVRDDPEIDEIRAEDFELSPPLRHGPPAGDFVIDVLTRLGTAFRSEDLEAGRLCVVGVPLRVATRTTPVRMEQGTVRPIDEADAAALTKFHGLEKRLGCRSGDSTVPRKLAKRCGCPATSGSPGAPMRCVRRGATAEGNAARGPRGNVSVSTPAPSWSRAAAAPAVPARGSSL